MCLTIPKKVLEIRENSVVVETYSGVRQELKSMIDLSIGDSVLSQSNIIIEKIDAAEADEILKLLPNEEAKQ